MVDDGLGHWRHINNTFSSMIAMWCRECEWLRICERGFCANWFICFYFNFGQQPQHLTKKRIDDNNNNSKTNRNIFVLCKYFIGE